MRLFVENACGCYKERISTTFSCVYLDPGFCSTQGQIYEKYVCVAASGIVVVGIVVEQENYYESHEIG